VAHATRRARPQPAVVEQHHALPLPDTGTLRIAVIADTHSRPHPRAKALLAAWKPEAIVHAGDIGDLDTAIDPFAELAPVLAVRGNIDARAPHLPDVIVLDLMRAEARALRIFVTHIAVNGPRLRADAARAAIARQAALVICGHSHVPFIGRDHGLGMFNPGSIGPRRFALPIVFGTLEIDARGVHLAHTDAETGRAWSP
jgi:hypothetical protein